ncbi:MAG: DUF169 domain-containing protein [Deltaproteobacteria bacterium]|nr:DUF169 domain-containing protein [Candidatus Zymogenaceae bacterium]
MSQGKSAGRDTIEIDLPPVGVKFLCDSASGYEDITRFKGISYCQAVFGATFGMELLVVPESIQVCQWVPIVMGFKEAENEFERSITGHLPFPTEGIYIAPLFLFRKDVTPDVVLIRTDPDSYRVIIDFLGWDGFIELDGKGLDMTGLATFQKSPPSGFSKWAVKNINRILDVLNRFSLWQIITTTLFRSTFITRIFDRFITRYMANMSMCRNSTVIPFQTHRANISYFCTGGVAWGKNNPRHMTSGFPYDTFLRLDEILDYPGKGENDPRLDRLEKKKSLLLERAKRTPGCTFG